MRRIESHEVEQGQRTHRVAASELHRLVDVGHAANAALHGANGIQQVRNEEQVDDKPRVVLRGDGLLAQRCRECKGLFERLVGRRHRPHDFDQRHQRNRVEEVKTDEPVRAFRSGGHLDNREAGGVGGENRPCVAQGIQLLEQRVLQGDVLGDGLDHDVDRFQVRDGRRELQARERGVAICGLQLPFLDEFGERFLDSRAPAVQELLRDVAHDGVVARGRRDLRDAAAHQSTAQNAHTFDVGHDRHRPPRGRGRGFSNALRTSSAILTSGCTPGNDGVSRISARSRRSSTCSSEMWIRSLSAR